MVAEMITVFCQESYNSSNIIYINFSEENKKEKGSNREVKPNRLIHVSKNNNKKYLNISINLNEGARVAERLMQSLDTRCPSGLTGSIPVPGAFPAFFPNLLMQSALACKEVGNE